MNALVGLPQIAPFEAQLRTDILGALNGIEAGGRVLTASLPSSTPELTWYLCTDGLAFSIERLEGEPVRLSADDGVSAAELLDGAEPVLRAIEWALGIELEPKSLATEHLPADSFLVRVEDCACSARITLALPRALSLVTRPAPFAPRLLDPVPFPALLTLSGPRLSPNDAADLEPGDLLLLGEGPLRASLAFLGRGGLPGLYDPAASRFMPLDGTPE